MSSNNNIKGLTVEIGGDTTKLGAALRGADQSIQSSAKELRELDKLLKLDPKNTELLQQKQEVLAESIGKTKERLDTLRTAQEQAKPRLENYDAWKQKNDVLSGSITEVEKKLARLRAAQEDLTETEGVDSASYSELAEQIAATEKQIKKLKKEQKDLADEYGHPISPESYRSLQREISRTEQTLRDYERQQKDAAKAADELNHAADNAADSSSDLGKAAEQAGRQIEDSAKQAADAAKKAAALAKENEELKKSYDDAKASAKEAAKDMAKDFAAPFAAGAAVAGVGISAAMSYEDAMASLQMQTGATAAQMQQYGDTMDAVYRQGYGENMDDVAATMVTIMQTSRETDPARLQAMAKNALTLRDAFGFDTAEQMRAVDMLMTQFGLDAEEAYNLIAQGAQKGLNRNGDMMDVINEYAVHYRQLGYTAEEFFGSLVNGAESGTFSVDKLGDAMKEFGNKARDSSQTTIDAFAELGYVSLSALDKLHEHEAELQAQLDKAKDPEKISALNEELIGVQREIEVMESALTYGVGSVEDLQTRIADGGETAKAAMSEVLTLLFSVDDQVLQNQIGVALFGTMWEDLGIDAIKALTNVESDLDATKNTMQDIKEIKYNTTQKQWEQLGRTAQRELIAPLGEKLLPTAKKLLSYCIKNIDKLLPMIKTTATTLASMWVGKKIGNCISSVSKAVDAFKKLKKASEAASGVMSATPWGLVGAAAGALIGVFAGLIKAERDAAEAAQEAARKTAQAYQDAADAALESQRTRAGTAQDIQDEYDIYRNLIKELDGIVDANGRVKEGYEKRAQWITERFSEVAGIEIQITDGVIQKYGELADMLDTVLLKKQAEALLTSQQGDYDAAKAAIDSTEKDENGNYAAGSRMAYETANQVYQDAIVLAQEYPILLADYNSTMAEIEADYSAGIITREEMLAQQAAVDEKLAAAEEADRTLAAKKQTRDDALLAYEANAATVSSYENLQTAAWGDDPEALAAAIGESTAALMTAATASLASLTKQLDDATKEYEQWSELSTQGNSTITAKDLAEKRNRVLRAAYEVQQEMLQNSEDYTQQELDDAEQMFLDTLRSIWNLTDDQLSEVAEVMAERGFDAGMLFGEGLAKGLDKATAVVRDSSAALARIPPSTTKSVLQIASPSKVGFRQARNYGASLGLGLEREAETVAQKAARLARSITETVDGELPAPAMALVQQGTNFAPTAAYHESGSNVTLEDVSTRLDAILAVVQAINPRLVLDDGTLVAKTASKTNDALGIITERERRGRL